MIVDGRGIASDILAQVKAGLNGAHPLVRAITIQPSAATDSYLRIKTQRAEEAGMRLEVVRLKDAASIQSIVEEIQKPGADAIIVQLPIPDSLDWDTVLNAIPLLKDADVLSGAAYARFEKQEEGALIPPVAASMLEILRRSSVSVEGKRAVVVGKGQLVGKPCATTLARLGAYVTAVDRTTEHPEHLYIDADIIVSGAGVSHLITPEVVKEGVILIDAGTSGASGAVSGDIHPACAEKASLFTPVPGGVGPIAVASLFKNVASLVGTRTARL